MYIWALTFRSRCLFLLLMLMGHFQVTIFGRSIIYAEWTTGRRRVRDHRNDNDSTLEIALVQINSGGAMKRAWYVLQRAQGMTEAPHLGRRAGVSIPHTHASYLFPLFDGRRQVPRAGQDV